MRLHAGTAVERRGSSLREGFFVDRVGQCPAQCATRGRSTVQRGNEFHAADCVHKRVEARSTLDLRWQIGLSEFNESEPQVSGARRPVTAQRRRVADKRPLSSGGIPRLWANLETWDPVFLTLARPATRWR